MQISNNKTFKKIIYLILLISASGYSQDKLVFISDYDLKFKIPLNYESREIPNAKMYTYENSEITISLAILKEEREVIGDANLKRFYLGFIDGFTKEDNEIISYDTYKLDDYLVAKSIQKNKDKNFVEAHIVHINGNSYVGVVRYSTSASKEILKLKDSFLNSLRIK